MNTQTKPILLTLCALFVLASHQGFANTAAQLYLVQGGNPVGFISDASSTAIKFSEQRGGPVKIYRFSDIKGEGLRKGIVLDDRVEVLAPGRTAFAKGDFRTAAGEFKKVAERYAFVLNIPQNFASEAKFYEIECYRRAGAFQAIKGALESRAGKSIDTQLNERYKTLSKLHKLWAVYGANDMAQLEQDLAIYQMPATGQAKLLPAPSFKKMPHGELAQVAFMRAKVFESKNEPQKALQDYYRVITHGQGYDPYLTKQALGAAMVIQGKDPGLKSDREKTKETSERHMQSITYMFSKRFPDTTIPLQFQDYAVRPKVKIDLAIKPKEEAPKEKPSEGDAKPAADAGKGKGEAKPKAKPKANPKKKKGKK